MYNSINESLKSQLHSPRKLKLRLREHKSTALVPIHRCQPIQNQVATSTGRALKSLKRIIEVTPGKSGRQSTSEGTPIQRSTPHGGLNFHQSTTLYWDLQIKILLEILLEALDLSNSQHLPTDEKTSWSWYYLGYNFLGECSWGFKLSFIDKISVFQKIVILPIW